MNSKAFWVLGVLLSLSLCIPLYAMADNELFGQQLFRDEAGVPMLLIGLTTMWALTLSMLHELVTRQPRQQ